MIYLMAQWSEYYYHWSIIRADIHTVIYYYQHSVSGLIQIASQSLASSGSSKIF